MRSRIAGFGLRASVGEHLQMQGPCSKKLVAASASCSNFCRISTRFERHAVEVLLRLKFWCGVPKGYMQAKSSDFGNRQPMAPNNHLSALSLVGGSHLNRPSYSGPLGALHPCRQCVRIALVQTTKPCVSPTPRPEGASSIAIGSCSKALVRAHDPLRFM